MLVACSAMEEKSAPADTVPPNPELSPCCEAHEKARTKNETRYLYRGTEWNTFYQTDEIRVGQRVAVFYKTHEIRGNWYLAEITSVINADEGRYKICFPYFKKPDKEYTPPPSNIRCLSDDTPKRFNRKCFLHWLDVWASKLETEGHKLEPIEAMPCRNRYALNVIQVKMACNCASCNGKPHSIWIYSWGEPRNTPLSVEVWPAEKDWKPIGKAAEPQEVTNPISWRDFNDFLFPEGADFCLTPWCLNAALCRNDMNCFGFANRAAEKLGVEKFASCCSNWCAYNTACCRDTCMSWLKYFCTC